MLGHITIPAKQLKIVGKALLDNVTIVVFSRRKARVTALRCPVSVDMING